MKKKKNTGRFFFSTRGPSTTRGAVEKKKKKKTAVETKPALRRLGVPWAPRARVLDLRLLSRGNPEGLHCLGNPPVFFVFRKVWIWAIKVEGTRSPLFQNSFIESWNPLKWVNSSG